MWTDVINLSIAFFFFFLEFFHIRLRWVWIKKKKNKIKKLVSHLRFCCQNQFIITWFAERWSHVDIHHKIELNSFLLFSVWIVNALKHYILMWMWRRLWKTRERNLKLNFHVHFPIALKRFAMLAIFFRRNIHQNCNIF